MNAYIKRFFKEYTDYILSSLQEKEDKTGLLIYSAIIQDNSCSAWLRAIPRDIGLRMNDEMMINSIHFRLNQGDDTEELIKDIYGIKTRLDTCPLCKNRWSQYHYSNCHLLRPLRTRRHHTIKKLLGEMFKLVPNVIVKFEERSQNMKPLREGRKRK